MAEEIERMPEEEVRGGVRKGPATAYKKSELGAAVKFPVRPVSWRMQAPSRKGVRARRSKVLGKG